MSDIATRGRVRPNGLSLWNAKLHARRAMQWCFASCVFAMLFMHYAHICLNAVPYVMLALMVVSLRRTYVHVTAVRNQVTSLDRKSGWRHHEGLDKTSEYS